MTDRDEARSNHVAKAVEAGLCHSCGACQAICPVEAICFIETVGGHFYPAIDESLCTHCGRCLGVCAGIAANTALSRVLAPDPFRGVCLDSLIGKSADAAVFAGAQSGGVVSQLLVHLLECGRVDACAVVRMVPGNPPRPTAFLARSKQEILEAQKSKYCPVPVLSVLREIGQANHRIAMVGLACHFHGLSLIEDVDIDLASLVDLKIGLICDRTLTLAAVDYLLERASHRGKSAQLVFRDRARTGYPGDVTVHDKSGDVSVLPKSERMAIKDVFTPARCRLCFDKMNVLADLTIGDPWGIKGADRKHGESVVIVRTERGRSAVTRGLNNGSLSLRPVDYEQVMVGQKIGTKRADWRAYCGAWQAMGETLPGFFQHVVARAPRSNSPTYRHRRHLSSARRLDAHKSREALLRSARRVVRLGLLRRHLTRGLGLHEV